MLAHVLGWPVDRGRAVFRGLARQRPWHLLLAAVPLVLLGCYAAAHIWVCDDAFISFRYANNLILGHGLVFNPGERVEGYTGFLWVLETAALYALGIPIGAAAVFLSVLSTIGVLVLVARLARTTPTIAFSGFAVVSAWMLLASNRNVAVWTTGGLEARQFTFLVLLSIWWVRGHTARPAALVWASCALATAELTRPEGTLVWASVVAWYVFDAARARMLTLKGLARLVLPFLLVVSAHYLWRRFYYGQWLPNTFHAKVVAPWFDAGVVYYGTAALESGLYLSVPLGLLGGVYRWRRRKDSLLLLAALVILPHTLFFMGVGGDHFEFRILDLWWPLLAVVVADGLVFLSLCTRLAARRRRWPMRRLWSSVVGVGALSILLVYGSALQIAQCALEFPHRQDEDFAGHIETPLTPATFPPVFALPLMTHLATAYNTGMSLLVRHANAVRWIEHSVFERKVQRMYRAYMRKDRELLPDGAIMAHPWPGIISFSLPEVTIVDMGGLTDRAVAQYARPDAERAMAHDRVPPPGYLEQRGVNLAVLPARKTLASALSEGRFAVRLAPDLWAPLDSRKPDWVRSAFVDRELFEIRWKAPETSIIEGRKVQRAEQLLDCEAEPQGWSMTGGLACVSSPVPKQKGVTGFRGRSWLSSYTSAQRDKAQGRGISPSFRAERGAYLFFKIAGGGLQGVGVRLVGSGGRVLKHWRGKDSEAFTLVAAELGPHAGQDVHLEVIDEETAGWGHVLVDDILILYAD